MDSKLEFEIAYILDSKLDHRQCEPLLYYVQWAGYKGTLEKNSWLSASELDYMSELV